MSYIKNYYWDEINAMYSPDVPYDVTWYMEELEAYQQYESYLEDEEEDNEE